MAFVPHGNYYEGVLQLRNASQKLTDFVLRTIQTDDRAAITKVIQVPQGIDYYLTSQKYLQILGKKIRSNFRGEYKLSSTLHTQSRTGEELYRITIFFREFSFKRGDTVIIHGDPWVIVLIDKQVCCRHVESGKREWFLLSQVKKE